MQSPKTVSLWNQRQSVQHGPTKSDTQPDLPVTNKKELAGGMVINSSFGSSGHGIVKFKILTGVRKDSSRVLMWTSGEQTSVYSGDCKWVPMRSSSEGPSMSGKLAGLQGQHPPSARMIHPDIQEDK